MSILDAMPVPVNAVVVAARPIRLHVTITGAEKSKTFSFAVAGNLAKYLGEQLDHQSARVEGDAIATDAARYTFVGVTLADLGTVDGETFTPAQKPARQQRVEKQPVKVVADLDARKTVVKGWKSRKDRNEIARRVESFLETGVVAVLAGTHYELKAEAAAAI